MSGEEEGGEREEEEWKEEGGEQVGEEMESKAITAPLIHLWVATKIHAWTLPYLLPGP